MNGSPEKKNNAKQIVFLAVMALIIVLAVGGYVTTKKPGARKIIASGDIAPDFRLSSLDGRMVSLADFRGKVVMVHFWATWCPPCVEELPTLAYLNKALEGKDFVMLAVSVDEGGAPAVTAFLEKNKLSLPVLLDPDHATASSYGTYKFPETYILGRDGVVRKKVIGATDWRDPAALQAIQQIIDER